MFKYVMIGCSVVLGIAGFMNGSRMGELTSASASNAPVNVEQMLAAEAAKLNKEKGKVTGHSKFVEASAKGKTLYHFFELNLSPGQVNTVAAADDLRGKIKGSLCKDRGILRQAISQGAVLEYSYQTSRTQQFLFEVRIDNRTCMA